MIIVQLLRQASIVALLSLLVGLLPLVAGVAYAVRPTELRLALMRPLSLAGIFASLCGFLSGVVNIVRAIALSPGAVDWKLMTLATAESLVPLFAAFACLTVGWLSVAVGLRRHEAPQ